MELTSGKVISFLEFEEDVTEIFDVQLLVGLRNPHVVGLEKDTIARAFVLPRDDTKPD